MPSSIDPCSVLMNFLDCIDTAETHKSFLFLDCHLMLPLKLMPRDVSLESKLPTRKEVLILS